MEHGNENRRIMRIAITGSTGFVGSHLSNALKNEGHQIIPIGRADLANRAERLAERLQGCDAIINLAGETINRRWTPTYKRHIYNSRIETTEKLVDAMERLGKKPKLFISTSAIGAFAPEGCYNEDDEPNATDFLGKVSKDWEKAANRANEFGVRTLIYRFGLVLGCDGGMMKQLLLPFKLGLGGRVGDGKQHFSWVHIEDLIRSYQHAFDNDELNGIYHICAPNPVTNLVMTKTLGEVLNRPTLFPVPKLLLKLIYGEGADVMTSGQCVVSNRLSETGFEFKYPHLTRALEAIVNR